MPYAQTYILGMGYSILPHQAWWSLLWDRYFRFWLTRTGFNNKFAQSNLGKEGRVTALSHTYAVKSLLVTMARPKFAPKSTPSREPIPKPHYLPHPWTRPTYDAKRHPDPIRIWSAGLPQCTAQTDARTDRPTDRPRESLTTAGRCATRATRANNNKDIANANRPCDCCVILKS